MKRCILTVLVVLVSVAAMPFLGIAQDSGSSRQDKNIKVIREAGVGDKAKIELKLMDGSKVKGVIRSIDNDSFVVAVEKTSVEKTIAFDDVDSAKKPRKGLKPRTWAIIGGAAAAAIIISVTVLYPVLCDGGAGC